MANVNRVSRGKPQAIDVYQKTTSTDAIEQGDLLQILSAKAAVIASAADNLKFLGVAFDASPSGEAHVSVALPDGITVWEFPLNAATLVTPGSEFQGTGAQELTKSAVDAIAVAEGGQFVTATTVKARLKLTAAHAVGDAS